MNLAESLRRGALGYLAEAVSCSVTCQHVPSSERQIGPDGYWCRQIHGGHLCRWSGAPHRGFRHECFCGERWGSGG